MCGIVGYIGSREALPIIVEGLTSLEYRGYDSAGVAIIHQGKVDIARAAGKLKELKKLLLEKPLAPALIGIGHTRWATHGRPTETNAHPHTAGRVSLIHNGIIENYAELREKLIKEGRTFQSETDTEVAAHLLDSFLQAGKKPLEAFRLLCSTVEGSYAFLAIDSEHPDRILVAKNSTPIIIGVGEKEMIVASDIPAILPHTRDVIILDDGDLGEVFADKVVLEKNAQPVKRETQRITWDPVTAQKDGFKHFMLKEIHDQPQVVVDTMRGRLGVSQKEIVLKEVEDLIPDAKALQRVQLTACGTASYASLVAKYYLENLAGIPASVECASEFRYRPLLVSPKDLVIAVTQSGETLDTLGAVESVLGSSKTLAICNVVGSSIARKVDSVLYTQAGPEISVASTKAFTTQIVTLLLFSAWLGEKRGVLSKDAQAEIVEALLKLPAALEESMQCEKQVEKVAQELHKASHCLYLGRGMCYPIALEGALKLKEISYIHAEGYPAGEMKHGPIALIDEHMPVVVVLARDEKLLPKSISNVKEVQARGGQVIVVTDADELPGLTGLESMTIRVPYVSKELSPIILTIPMQFLAYYVAVQKGTDVDLPRNLAKSVTVE